MLVNLKIPNTKKGKICSKCAKVFISNYHLNRHLTRKTSCDQVLQYECKNCHVVFNLKHVYIRHCNRKTSCVLDNSQKIKQLECKMEKLERKLIKSERLLSRKDNKITELKVLHEKKIAEQQMQITELKVLHGKKIAEQQKMILEKDIEINNFKNKSHSKIMDKREEIITLKNKLHASKMERLVEMNCKLINDYRYSFISNVLQQIPLPKLRKCLSQDPPNSRMMLGLLHKYLIKNKKIQEPLNDSWLIDVKNGLKVNVTSDEIIDFSTRALCLQALRLQKMEGIKNREIRLLQMNTTFVNNELTEPIADFFTDGNHLIF